jgi:hypothetical protein
MRKEMVSATAWCVAAVAAAAAGTAALRAALRSYECALSRAVSALESRPDPAGPADGADDIWLETEVLLESEALSAFLLGTPPASVRHARPCPARPARFRPVPRHDFDCRSRGYPAASRHRSRELCGRPGIPPPADYGGSPRETHNLM